MYCSNCNTELTDKKVNFCPNCGARLGDAISRGMQEFQVLDETEESIESGMKKFEIRGSSSTDNSENIQNKLNSVIETIKELLELWEGCYDNFSSVEIDFYKAVKFKLEEGTNVLLIDKHEDWEEWLKIYKDLERLFNEALYLLSLLKPKFFAGGTKRFIYNYWVNNYTELASKHNTLLEIVRNNSEFIFLEDVD